MTGASPIAGILLAAGLSSRAGPRNKLLAPMGGMPMIRCSAENLLASRAAPVIIVTGHQRQAVEQALAGLDAALIHNPDYAEGMASSLSSGLSAVPESAAGALIGLGDMPDVLPATMAALIDAFDPDAERQICRPAYQGRYGNPVLFSRGFFAAMAAIDGDRGAKDIVNSHEDWVVDVPVTDPGILVDYDNP